MFVDEFHELFFNQQAVLVNGKIVSVITKLKAATRLIGVSATYRGDVGIKKINNIMNAQFLKTPHSIKERELQLEVFGEVTDIPTQAAHLAKEKAKTLPVIIFCLNP